MKYKVYCSLFAEGFTIIEALSLQNAELWAIERCLDYEFRIQSISRGGSRPGAGRPKNSYGTGKWGGQETVAVRIPKKLADNVETFSDVYDSLVSLSSFFKLQAEKAKHESKTCDYPRTWDKAIKLLAEIDELLQQENIII